MRYKWIFIGCLLCIIFVVVLWRRGAGPSDVRMPNPNGYTGLVQASRLVVDLPSDIQEASLDELDTALAANQEPRRLVREALKHDSCVPTDAAQDPAERTVIRQVGRLLQAEIQRSVLRENWADAAEQCLELAGVGRMMSRGGMLIDLHLGGAYERLAWTEAERIAASMTPHVRKGFLDQLATIDIERDPLNQMMARERKNARSTVSVFHMLFYGRLVAPARADAAAVLAELDILRDRTVAAMKAE